MAETFTRRIRNNNAIYIPIEIVDLLNLKKDMLVQVTIKPQNQNQKQKKS